MAHPPANPLMIPLASGQPDSYAALFDRLGRPMLRVAYVMLRNHNDAEDAAQDVFVELVRHRDRLAHVADLDAYIFAMLRNNVARRIQHEKKERQNLRLLVPIATTAQQECSTDGLDEALKSLPPEQREIVALKIDGGLTFAQIAEILEVNPNTAASRYRYALTKLRQILE